MSIKRILGLTLVICALAAFAIPISGFAAEESEGFSIYFRPAVRFGSDDRTLYIADFLIPLYQGEKNILFFNPRYSFDDLDGSEVNLGIGYRHLLFNDKLILGANVFYDTRRTGWGTYWDQVGVGVEAMTEINKYVALTGRFNYYIPLTDPIVSGSGGTGGGYIFRDQGIYTLGGGMVEEAPEGFDAELGFRVPFVSDYVETWVYGGGYHYSGKYISDIDGWSARLELIPTDFLRLNYEYREDRTNHGEHFGEVALEVPFSIDNLIAGKNPFAGMGDMLKGSRDMKERMVEPVRRDVDIVVMTEESGGGSAGSLAEGVIFVSDTGSASGDGSYENPYNSLATALVDSRLGVSVFTIHVLADKGSGIGGSTLATAGITLWGAGAPNPKYANIMNFIPGTSTITSALTMNATNQTIMGLYFNVSGSSAITIGSGAANAGLSIIGNTINSTGANGNGIYGIYASFNNNQGTAGDPVVISGNTISIDSSSNAYGIYLGNLSTGSIYATVLNNRIDVDTSGSSANGIFLNANAGGSGAIGHLVSTISGNTITNVSATTGSLASGIYLFGRTDITVSITNNTISGIVNPSNAYGVYLNSVGLISGSVTGNTITGISSTYRSYGMYASTNGTLGTALSPLVFTGNSGTISAGAAYETYMAYLQASIPASSYVNIGTDTSGIGMGDNNFTTTTNWDGNYLTTGGPIRTNNSSYIHNTNP